MRACVHAGTHTHAPPSPSPPARAQQARKVAAASVALRSGGGLGASKLVGGAAGGKQKVVLARAATAERWEKLVLGIMLIGKKPRADPHTFVPSMSLRVDEYKFVKPPRSNVEHAAPLVRMPAFEQQPSKVKWNSSPR